MRCTELIEKLKLWVSQTTTANSPSPITITALNNANSLGNVEELDCVKEADGAMDTMAVRTLHFLFKPAASPQITDPVSKYLRVKN